MVTKLEEKWETLWELFIRPCTNTLSLPKVTPSSKRIVAWVCMCRRYFRSILILGIRGSSHKHHIGWSFSWSLRERNFQSIRGENILLPRVHACFTSCRQGGLMLHECSIIGMNVNIWNSPCFHRCDQVVCLRWCFRQTICLTILCWNMCKIMKIPWTSFLSQHRNHVDGLLMFK